MKKILKLSLSAAFIVTSAFAGQGTENFKSEFANIASKFKKESQNITDEEIEYVVKNFEHLKELRSNKRGTAVEMLIQMKPKVAIRWLREGKIGTLSGVGSDTLIRHTIRLLVQHKVDEAVSVLKHFAECEDLDANVASMARYAADILSGNLAKEKYRKNTPQQLLCSYGEYLRKRKKELTIKDEEKEFWTYPRYFQERWREWKKRMKKNSEYRQLLVKTVLEISERIARRSNKIDRGGFFTLTDNRRAVTEVIDIDPAAGGGQGKLHLYKDMQGKWRLSH